MTTHFFYRFPSGFPLEDTIAIAERLEASGGLVPGFIPPEVGLLDLAGLIYCQEVDKRSLIVLPDRNLVSRMAQVARYGAPLDQGPASRMAVDLMAFCQAMSINFEPSIAFHELAFQMGNEAAREELGWFRAADRGAGPEWVDLAMGRRSQLDLGSPELPTSGDLAYPLKRWRRNYIVMLKIAELELDNIRPIERVLTLFQWMWDEFIIAGSAAMFATVYFAPNSRRKRLLKHLRSPTREKAIEGIMNAAWDMTHLSEFVARVKRADLAGERVIFATADGGLARIAPMTLSSPFENAEQTMLSTLLDGWTREDVDLILANVQRFFGDIDIAPTQRPAPRNGTNIIHNMTQQGEDIVRRWRGFGETI